MTDDNGYNTPTTVQLISHHEDGPYTYTVDVHCPGIERIDRHTARKVLTGADPALRAHLQDLRKRGLSLTQAVDVYERYLTAAVDRKCFGVTVAKGAPNGKDTVYRTISA